jgi:AhpD family alkylhydroperoxidase
MSARIPLFELAPANLQAMINLCSTVQNSSLGWRMVEMIGLRLAQINGSGFCMEMHWHELIKHDTDPHYLNAIASWRDAPFFSERERAALNWAEKVNAIPLSEPSDDDFAQLQAHFSPNEIAELAYAIAVAKGWNAINISLRNKFPDALAAGA